MIQSPQRATPAPLQPALAVPASPGEYPGHGTLLIGQLALSSKDATVLRALVRLLDGSLGMSLRYSEDHRDGHLVFVAGTAAAGSTGRTNIWVIDPLLPNRLPADAITVSSPLRIGAVIAGLQQAFARLRPRGSAEQVQCLSELFQRLRQALQLGGVNALGFGSGQLMQIDAESQCLRATLPLDELLTQLHGLGALRPSHGFDEQRLRGAASQDLGAWLWRLSAHRLSAQAAHPPLSGAWRLRRWPQAAGLMAPGHPQWAALLARRPCGVAELAQRSKAPLVSVLAFMATCEALGLLVSHAGADDAAPLADSSAVPAAGWLQQMRVALALW